MSTTTTAARPGRKPDRALDEALLQATIDVVVEVGYERTTMDLVAQRAGSTKSALYRRWRSKGALTLDAISMLQAPETDLETLPDHGSLRADLMALTEPYETEAGRVKLRLMAGLASLLDQEPELTDAIERLVVTPWIEVCRRLIERAVERGEAATDDPATVARVVPAMTSHRLLVERGAVDRVFFVSLIDTVVLPALRPSP
ncbi:TetR/AcrR family transcriptional regulator [Nocardioides marinquilinus]|uniref:TetR/AcrR family transcriptional regulator n=1 Tax=Nocardioides marinquilinus TaxID=1210400 RepID=UPI0031ED4E08